MTARTPLRWAAAALALTIALAAGATSQATGRNGKKPELLIRASPTIAFAPATVRFTASLQGGDDDYEEYYCPSIEWDWDDETVSESTPDCNPYESGRSRITRQFTASHRFQAGGYYEVRFKLKQNKKVLTNASVRVHIRAGLP